jgi:hypothetical protein
MMRSPFLELPPAVSAADLDLPTCCSVLRVFLARQARGPPTLNSTASNDTRLLLYFFFKRTRFYQSARASEEGIRILPIDPT